MNARNGHVDLKTVRKILFVTNAESGQANTILSLALEASTRQQLEVHVASYPVLKRRLDKLSSKIGFHPLDGNGSFENFEAHGHSEQNFSHPPVTKTFAPYDRLKLVWNGERASICPCCLR